MTSTAERASQPAMGPRQAPSDNGDRTVADAPARNVVDRYAPPAWKPWLRLARYDRPIGSWLLMWPCQWSAALAAIAVGSTAQLPWHIALFFLGGFVMRGAGSTWNDFLDRDIDGRVERTRNRPIPAGQVTAKGAFCFAIVQSLIGLVVLLQFNRFTILLGIASLAPVAIYPLMKRVMGYPQAVLGLCFAWGALMGFAAVFGQVPWEALVLYAGAIAWVIGYDTIYGHQDQRDDAVIGIKSTSRTFGIWSRPIIGGLYATTISLIGIAVWGVGGSWPSLAGLMAFAAHLAWQVRRLDPNRPDICLMLFRSNRDAGALLFIGLVTDALMR